VKLSSDQHDGIASPSGLGRLAPSRDTAPIVQIWSPSVRNAFRLIDDARAES
jgi:hypothetical protein